MGKSNELFGLGDVFFEWEGRTVEHDGGEADLNAGLRGFIGTVV